MKMREWGTCLFFVVAVLLFGQPSFVAAQSELESSASYTFGQTMSFFLRGEAVSASATVFVQTATLVFEAEEWEQPLFVPIPVEPSREIDLAWDVSINEAPVAPFTTVIYYWELLYQDGSSFVVPPEVFYYEDNRFEWVQQSAVDVVVNWVGRAQLGNAAIEIVAATQVQLDNYLPSVSPESAQSEQLQLYIYPSSADLRAALRLTGRDWVNRHADPALGVVLVTAVNERTAVADLSRAIPHELAHRRLYQLAEENYAQIPAWFAEGMATLVETTANPAHEAALETAVSTQTLLPFSALCGGLPRDGKASILIEAQSVSLLKMIQARYGNQAIRGLAAEYAAGVACETAVTRIMNKSLPQLEQEWLQTEQQSPVTQFWNKYALLFLLILLGLPLMGLIIWKL